MFAFCVCDSIMLNTPGQLQQEFFFSGFFQGRVGIQKYAEVFYVSIEHF